MTIFLTSTAFLSVFNCSIVLLAFNSEELNEYPDEKTFSQRIVIQNCGMGYKMLAVFSIFLLWSAACLLGLKYKMISHKIHVAVSE
jgi:hypothetical protein